MKMVIGSDHAGFQMKAAMGDLLRALGHDVLDVGAFNETHPTIRTLPKLWAGRSWTARPNAACSSAAAASARAWQQISCGIRAAVCHDSYSAHQGVEHDDMNVIVLGSRIIGSKLAEDLVKAFLAAKIYERRTARAAAWKSESSRSKVCGGLETIGKTTGIRSEKRAQAAEAYNGISKLIRCEGELV